MKYLIILILLCLAFSNLTGQKLVTITINLDSVDETSLETLQDKLNELNQGDFYRVRITGINSYYYNFIITTKDTTLESNGSIPTFSSISLDNITNLFASLSPISITAPKQFQSLDTIVPEQIGNSEGKQGKCNKYLYAQLKTIDTHAKTYINQANIVRDYSEHDFSSANFNFNKFESSLSKLESQLEQLELMYDQFKVESIEERKCDSESALYTQVDNEYKKLINNIQKSLELKYDVLNSLSINLYNHNLILLQQESKEFDVISDSVNIWQSIGVSLLPYALRFESIPEGFKKDALASIIEIRSNLLKNAAKLRSSISIKKQNFIHENAQIISRYTNKPSDDLMDRANLVLAAYEESDKTLDSLVVKLSAESMETFLRETAALINSSNTTYTDLPRQLVGDQVSLKISIVPKDLSMGLNSYLTTLTFPSRKKYFFGSGTSMYIGWLRNDSYSIQSMMKNDTTTSYSLVEEDSDEYEVGTYVHANFVWSILDNEKLGIGVSLGPGVSFTKTVRPRVLAGVSISYGNINKAVLSFGAITGYVDRLSKSLDTSTEYMTAPENIVVSRMHTNYFASLGFVHSF